MITVERCVAAYALVAVITFGHAYSETPDQWTDYDGHAHVFTPPEKSLASLFCSAFWPLYWSAQGWKR